MPLEKNIRKFRDTYIPMLANILGDRLARLEVAVYIDLIIRCAFSKPWPATLEPQVKLPIGKFSNDKSRDLEMCGLKWWT